ncbi:MAG: hypothetical protein AAF085_02905 [Planctomycetota bacterium]
MFLGFASKKDNPPANPQSAPDPELDDEFLDEEEESVGEEISKTLVALMPWGISILFHVALIVVAFFLVWQTIIMAEEEQPVIPNSKLSESPGAPMVIEEVQEESADSPMTVPVVDPVVTDPQPTVTDTPIPTQLVGLTYAGGQSGGPLGNTTGNGDFGANVFGNGGNAKNIAFIVDASGSMVDVLPFVVNELKRVVNELVPAQNITIIMFSGEGVYEVPGGGRLKGLRACTPKFKEDIREWVSLENFKFQTGGRGSQNVEAAIIRGLSYKPQLVFLLSDNLTGGGQGATQHEIFQEDLFDAIVAANDHKPPAKFNTIQFLYEDPLIRAGLQGTLQLIAEGTGGNYKFIGASDLNLK